MGGGAGPRGKMGACPSGRRSQRVATCVGPRGHQIHFLYVISMLEREPRRSGKAVAMRSWVQALKIASYRNVEKSYIHKTQSGRTMHKWELSAPDCPFYM
jgi:hypothetical protein